MDRPFKIASATLIRVVVEFFELVVRFVGVALVENTAIGLEFDSVGSGKEPANEDFKGARRRHEP